MHLSVSHTSANLAPRWTASDDAAVSAAASARSGRAWPGWVDCPTRGRITAGEASKRFCALGKRPRPRGTIANVDVPVPESVAQRTRRMTPVPERAQNSGVVLKPTPEGLREAAASRIFNWLVAPTPKRCFTNTKRSFGKPPVTGPGSGPTSLSSTSSSS